MGSSTDRRLDTEEERQRVIEELIAEHGPSWLEQYKPGSFGCHELLDRAAMMGDAVEQFVLTHPACAQKPEWYARAEQAATALRELYQLVGAEHLASEESHHNP